MGLNAPNNNFKSWYHNQKEPQEAPLAPPEKKFFDVVGVRIISLKSFVSWLMLKGMINARVRGQAITEFPIEKKIYYIIVHVPNIRAVAEEFNSIFSNLRE